MRIRVIGVGTRRGDDSAGLLVADALAGEAWPGAVEIRLCEQPGPDLLDALSGADAVILIDAVRTGRPPGAVHEIGQADLPCARSLSSHAIGVGETLRLAGALGRAPARVAIVGVEGTRTAGDAPSPAVLSALPAACALVRELLSRLLDGAA